jgi:hypothetical protein
MKDFDKRLRSLIKTLNSRDVVNKDDSQLKKSQALGLNAANVLAKSILADCTNFNPKDGLDIKFLPLDDIQSKYHDDHVLLVWNLEDIFHHSLHFTSDLQKLSAENSASEKRTALQGAFSNCRNAKQHVEECYQSNIIHTGVRSFVIRVDGEMSNWFPFLETYSRRFSR